MQLSTKLRKQAANQGGFTLIELLVVIGILAILLAITLIALNPTQHFQGARNSQRSSDVTAILDSIYEYQAANTGNLPASVQGLTAATTYDIRSTAAVGNKVDLCANLVPTYVADMPLDPDTNFGTKTGATACAGGTDTYATGYTITKSATGRITVSAPHAENSATISVTR